jgi:hypothetical protein
MLSIVVEVKRARVCSPEADKRTGRFTELTEPRSINGEDRFRVN